MKLGNQCDVGDMRMNACAKPASHTHGILDEMLRAK